VLSNTLAEIGFTLKEKAAKKKKLGKRIRQVDVGMHDNGKEAPKRVGDVARQSPEGGRAVGTRRNEDVAEEIAGCFICVPI